MPNAAQKTNSVSGILGVASLIAGVAVFATRRRADEPEAKNAVK
jgi:LPXTG-motif cell wall-anchored protein